VLDQDFDSQVDMLDESAGDDAGGADQFIPNFRLPNISMSMQGQLPPATSSMTNAIGGPYGAESHGFDPYDPMLDADPFGLSASMHFPTPYTYDPHQIRR
jgi:hypothetical protein